mgnify:CR=1 FL=1
MRFLKYPFRLLNGLLDRLLALLGAAGMAQFPQFFSQYLQRLGGHLAEAKFLLLRYEMTAEYFNLTLEEYIAIHVNSGNEVLASSGQIINELIQRIGTLEQSYQRLQAASPWTRWWVFLRSLDPVLCRETWADFTPGIPTTLEGAAYALCGLILAWGIYAGLKSLVRLTGRLVSAPFSRRPRIPRNLLAN